MAKDIRVGMLKTKEARKSKENRKKKKRGV
jgi:hypothetical protein